MLKHFCYHHPDSFLQLISRNDQQVKEFDLWKQTFLDSDEPPLTLESSERPRGLRNDDHHPAPRYLLGPLRPPTPLVTTGWQRRDSAHAKSQQARASIGIVSTEIMAAGCDDDKLSECLELIDEHERRKAEEKERNERLIREAAERDLETKRLEMELLKARGSSEGQKNLAYGDGVVCALTRSKARELATRAAPLDVPSRITEKAGDGEPTNTVDTITTSTDQVSDEGGDENEEDPLESGIVFLAWWTHVLSSEKECWPAEREPFSNFGRRYQRLQITRVPEDCSRAASRCPRLQHTSIVFIDLSPQRWMTFVRRGLGRPPGKLLQSSNKILGPDAPKRAFPSSRTFCVGAGCHLHRLCLSRLCALPAGQWLRAGPSGMCGRPVVCYRRDCREFLLRGRVVASESPRVCHVHLPRVSRDTCVVLSISGWFPEETFRLDLRNCTARQREQPARRKQESVARRVVVRTLLSNMLQINVLLSFPLRLSLCLSSREF
ncbi:hypothetical protein HPB51_022549 [Rhipicephalus microplus]|uniref:Uncharacterized protein n=1 Tax=Rhipicephalus microplus TaxID=6941 RepID=A0A9J6DCJ7_RHIMP|nr:hypothetical protein HPB51_022549 [Rhipicephalus microplus]